MAPINNDYRWAKSEDNKRFSRVLKVSIKLESSSGLINGTLQQKYYDFVLVDNGCTSVDYKAPFGKYRVK